MNCIPARTFTGNAQAQLRSRVVQFVALLWLTMSLCSCSAPASESENPPPAKDLTYQADYLLTPEPLAGGTRVELRVSQSRRLLRGFDMQRGNIDLSSLDGDGEVTVEGDRIVWNPPASGGVLTWFAPIDHVRSGQQLDAQINLEWAIFRASDVMPAARTRTVRGARSETYLSFNLPLGWSSLTPYYGRQNRYRVPNPQRRFDKPSGWILLGRFGRRNETIAGRRVVVAGPKDQSVRRMDMLALLHWTLPELTSLLPDFPKRLTIVSAGDPMWRGGLSAPNSLFIHADRPLLSENGTSTLLHELMHIGIGLRADAGGDWIVEGLAEYYGLELLRRTGTISTKRHAEALKELEEWGENVEELCSERASGAVTARAVGVLHRLDRELRQTSSASLDDVLRQLVTDNRDMRLADLQSVAKALAGELPEALATQNLPGCGS